MKALCKFCGENLVDPKSDSNEGIQLFVNGVYVYNRGVIIDKESEIDADDIDNESVMEMFDFDAKEYSCPNCGKILGKTIKEVWKNVKIQK